MTFEEPHRWSRAHRDECVEHAVEEREEKTVPLRESVLTLGDEVERVPQDACSK